MKKKRFLKLVMSYGIQRDEAARMAARVGEFGSYEALFLAICSTQWGQPLPPAFPLLCAGMLTARRSGSRNKRIFRRWEMCSCCQRMKS